MAWFSRKRKEKGTESLKTLSEEEIQQKLYGQFDLRNTLAEEPAEAEDPDSESDGSDSGRFAKQPAVPPTQNAFEEKKRFDRLTIVKDEDLKVEPTPKIIKHPKRPSRKPSSFKFKLISLKPILTTLRMVIVVVLTKVTELLITGIRFLLKGIKWVDPRRRAVRRVIYWMAGLALVFCLFMGIHILNVQREKAMRSSAGVSAVAPKFERRTTVNAAESPLVAITGQEETVEIAQSESEEELDASVSGDSPALPYVIQVATYVGPQDAARVSEDLSEAKFPGFVQKLSRSGGRVYYSVFLGRYATFQEAQNKLVQFRKHRASRPFSDAFIRSLT
ncbi:MAG: SPOR domain-containing protein [Candidatus Omnitrophota bacterium]|nr:SPOR domain-containing protein [Candidatus Omnitrophota bacterium]